MYSISAGLDLTLSKTLFKCQLPDLDLAGIVWPKLTSVPPTSDIRGGAFYIKDANIISSNLNVYEKCYLSPRGGVFTLINSFSMSDTSSSYI